MRRHGRPAAAVSVGGGLRTGARELAIFLVVGGTSALAYTALGVLFTSGIGLRPSLAVLLSLALVLPPTYLAQKRLTFRSNRAHGSALFRYASTQAISNGVAVLGAELFADAIRAQPWLAFITIAVLVACLNYTLLKTWAFADDR